MLALGFNLYEDNTKLIAIIIAKRKTCLVENFENNL